jgi:hypothetical protein
MPLPESTVTPLITTATTLIAAGIGALCTYIVSARSHRFENLKLISSWAKSEELEKARIDAYRELWKCLGGISTFNHRDEIIRNLPGVQRRLHDWYYGGGGGLWLTGAAGQLNSPKASFFKARDFESTDPTEIWHVFHQLWTVIRRDLGIFESESDQSEYINKVKKKLGAFGPNA